MQTIKQVFPIFYTFIKMTFNKSQCTQGATYILKAKNKPLQMFTEQLLIQKNLKILQLNGQQTSHMYKTPNRSKTEKFGDGRNWQLITQLITRTKHYYYCLRGLISQLVTHL